MLSTKVQFKTYFNNGLYNTKFNTLAEQLNKAVYDNMPDEVHKYVTEINKLLDRAERNGYFDTNIGAMLFDCTPCNNYSYSLILALIVRKTQLRDEYIELYNSKWLNNLKSFL